MSKFIHDFEVIQNQRITDQYFVLHLHCPVPLPAIMPGQFAQVKVPDEAGVFLRRPISIYDTDYHSNTISLLIKAVGQGTLALSKLSKGQLLNMVYPLGNWFSLPTGDKCLLVGGGVGIAPMLLMAKYLRENNFLPDILIGGRTAKDIIGIENFDPLGNVFVITEDGSMGEKGLVTHHELLSSLGHVYSAIYACGPDPMMKAVAKLAYHHRVACEVSLEHMMACGIGACLCCVVKTNDGNLTTCVDGPVFDTKKLKGWI